MRTPGPGAAVVKIPHSRLNSFHVIPPCPFLARELRRYKRLQKFFDSLEIYQRNWIIEAIQSAKREETRKRRARRAAEWLMEVMEAERDLPPAFKIAFARSPKARRAWEARDPSLPPRHVFTDLLPVRALFPAPKPFLHLIEELELSADRLAENAPNAKAPES